MEILAFILAAAALIWLLMTRSGIVQLEEKQQQCQKEVDRLNQRIGKILSELSSLREVAGRPEKAGVVPLVVVPPIEPPALKPPPPPAPAAEKPPRETAPAAQSLPPAPVRAPARPARRLDWEALIGVQLFSWIAGVALVFAAIFFLKYSPEHAWCWSGTSSASRLRLGHRAA